MEKKKPNVKVVRVDERLIHGQVQLWIKSLGVNLVIVANDEVSTDPMQQSLMKTVIPKEVGLRFWTVEKTAEVIWKAADRQTIFVVVKNTKDALRLSDLGFPIEELNVGNIHNGLAKEKISQFIYVSEEDKENLRQLRDNHNVKFNTKTSPVSNDGEKDVEPLMKAL